MKYAREQETGRVISVGDGIARIYGIDHAVYGEIVIFENGLKGMVQDIRQTVLAVLFLAKIQEYARTVKLYVQRKTQAFP